MKIFHCDHCDQLVFFENVRCLACDHALAYAPDVDDVLSLEPAEGEGLWQSARADAAGRTYRLCANYDRANVCNWAIPAEDPEALCASCRLTRVIPDLTQPGHPEAWYRLEVAKRRLVYSLLRLRLPVASKAADPEGGVAFELLADTEAKPVLTGHRDGVITINVAEADDAEREQRRRQLHEPYRTLLGHFRHESGHYYWERLLARGDRLDAFRERFGDERADYAAALQRHYEEGPSADWQARFISAYASAHPWEDWAETWAHYLHMTDTLETAAACGLSLRPRRADEPSFKTTAQEPCRADEPSFKTTAQEPSRVAFERNVAAWFPLTYVLNNLNRGLGLPDGYPFVLSPPVIDKLRFVHETIAACAPDVSRAIDSTPRAATASSARR
jgi:hypothetical protein